jgi:phosphatidyl-myo-inositol dimannoside synthase
VKILMISEVFPPRVGGSGRWFWELYRRLPREAVLIAAGQSAHAEEFDRSHDLRVTRLPLTFTTWDILSLRGLRQYAAAARLLDALVKRDRPDVLHCGKCLPEGLLAWLVKQRRGTPYLCFVHGEELTLARTSRNLNWLTRHILRGAERIVANSGHSRGILENDWGIAPERIVVLHPGVDTTRFIPAERDPSVRAQLGWHDRPVVLTVGALQKRKGQDSLIRALPAIRARFPDVLYAITGEGWERSYLEHLVEELGVQGQVQFRGVPSDEDLLRCYQQCDLFALPNRQVGWDIEGFGIVLLEAQACGKAVIAGKSGGTAETMQVPETGLVVPCEGPDDLAASVIELLSDRPRLAQMGEAARERVVEQFDWTLLSRRAERLFHLSRVLDKPSPTAQRVLP